MKRFFVPLVVLTGLGLGAAQAGEHVEGGGVVGECLMAAAHIYDLPPAALVIILNVEGGRLGVVSRNNNGTVDIGPMQINDTWLQKLSAHWHARMEDSFVAARDNFCANIEGGAWILRRALDEAHGDLWEGVALYHSHSEKHKLEYLHQVMTQALRLRRQADTEMAQTDMGGR
jgi:hypothetical protein